MSINHRGEALKKNIIFSFILWLFLFSGRSVTLPDGAQNTDRIYFYEYWGSLFLHTEIGNIHIVSDDTLFIETVKEVRGVSPESALVLLDFLQTETDTLSGILNCSFYGPGEDFPEGIEWKVDFICHVLPDMNLNLYSGTGNIDVHEMFGRVSCNVGIGNINMAGGNGTVELKMDTGNINLRWSLKNTDALLVKGNTGNITLLLPLSLSAQLTVKLPSGNFSISGFEEVLTNSSSEHGMYVYTLKEGGSKIDVENLQGNITILGY